MEAEEKRAQVEQTIRRYEEAFDRMLVLAKTPTTDKLVSSFLHNEDRNFALFNYVSEIHGDIEKLVNENYGVYRLYALDPNGATCAIAHDSTS